MSDCWMPSVCAQRFRPAAGVWLGAHSSSFPFCQWATQFCGSSGAWGMNGYMYAPSTTLAPGAAKAFSTSPSVRSFVAYAPLPIESALAWYDSLVCADVGCSAHVTFSCLRADSACHQLSATIATPGIRPCKLVVPSTTNACFTPGSVLM